MKIKNITPFIIALILLSSTHAALNTEELRQQAKNITVQAYPDADTVLLNDITHVTYQPDGTSQTHSDTAIKILTEKGKRSQRTLTLSFNISYGTNYFTRVERITPQGDIVPIDLSANSRTIVNPSQMSANIYNPNSKILQLSIPGLQIGDILRYQTEDIVTKTVVPDTWSDYQIFEANFPILRATYHVDAPASRPLHNILLKDEIPGTIRATQTTKEDRIQYTWQLQNVPQYFPEPQMPTPHTVTQRLLISTIPSWEELSRWYWNLCLPRMECTTPALEQTALDLTHGKSTQEKIEALFTFVSQEIRYMGITTEEEAPGYEPHDVSITFENRYGVCRDKAALLAAMLRIAGVDAFPVIIMAGPKKDEEVPQPFFNHAVTAALNDQGEYVLMDPTDENTKDIFPAYLQNMSYIVARPEGDTLRTSPIIPANQNLTRLHTHATLNQAGTLTAHTTIHFQGVNDTIYRTHFSKLKPEECRRFFEGHLRRTAPAAQLETLTFSPIELRDTTQPLTVQLDYRAEDLLAGTQTHRMLQLPQLGASIGYANFLLGNTGLTQRRFPLYTRITAGIEETLHLELDPSLGTPQLPTTAPTTSTNLLWNHQYVLNQNTLLTTNNLQLNTVQFSPAQYQQLRHDLEQIEYESSKQIILQQTPDTLPQPDIRILEHHETFTLTDAHSWHQHTQRKTKILTYAGQKEQAEIKLTYNPAWETVQVTNVLVTLPDGTTKTIRPEERNLMDAAWSASAPRYPAEKILVINLPSVEIGGTIQYETHRTVTHKPGFALQRSFNGFNPIDHKTLTVIHPNDLPLQIRNHDIQPTQTLESQTTTLRWEAHNQTPHLQEENLPAWHTFNPYVRIATTNWETYAQQIYTPLLTATQQQPNTQQLAQQLTQQLTTDRQRIRTLRDWVSQNIRAAGPTLSNLPLTSITPADTTLADRYGNRTDRMILLHTLLQAINIPSEFLLAAYSSLIPEETEPAQTLPGRTHFERLILKTQLDNTPLYLTGNSHYAPLGPTPFHRQPALHLPTGTIETIQIDPEFHDIDRTQYTFTLTPDGTLTYQQQASITGTAYEPFHRTYAEMTPENRRRHHQELLANIAQNAQPNGELITDYAHYPAHYSLSATAQRYAIQDQNYLYLQLPALFADLFNYRSPQRTLPLAQSNWIDQEIQLLLHLPPNHTPLITPQPLTLQLPNQTGTVQLTTHYDPQHHTLTLTGTAHIRPALIPANQFPQLIQADRQLSHPNRSTLLLLNTDP